MAKDEGRLIGLASPSLIVLAGTPREILKLRITLCMNGVIITGCFLSSIVFDLPRPDAYERFGVQLDYYYPYSNTFLSLNILSFAIPFFGVPISLSLSLSISIYCF